MQGQQEALRLCGLRFPFIKSLKLAAAHHGPIHLLVTDVVLSGKRGTVLANELASARPDMRVLLVSGYSNDTVAHDAVLTPNVALLQKPFTPNELVRKVREVLDGAE